MDSGRTLWYESWIDQFKVSHSSDVISHDQSGISVTITQDHQDHRIDSAFQLLKPSLSKSIRFPRAGSLASCFVNSIPSMNELRARLLIQPKFFCTEECCSKPVELVTVAASAAEIPEVHPSSCHSNSPPAVPSKFDWNFEEEELMERALPFGCVFGWWWSGCGLFLWHRSIDGRTSDDVTSESSRSSFCVCPWLLFSYGRKIKRKRPTKWMN